jgi:hypothetical protein
MIDITMKFNKVLIIISKIKGKRVAVEDTWASRCDFQHWHLRVTGSIQYKQKARAHTLSSSQRYISLG